MHRQQEGPGDPPVPQGLSPSRGSSCSSTQGFAGEKQTARDASLHRSTDTPRARTLRGHQPDHPASWVPVPGRAPSSSTGLLEPGASGDTGPTGGISHSRLSSYSPAASHPGPMQSVLLLARVWGTGAPFQGVLELLNQCFAALGLLPMPSTTQQPPWRATPKVPRNKGSCQPYLELAATQLPQPPFN